MVTLYSTGCPRCNVLAQKLTDRGIAFKISDDVDDMIRRGFLSVPVLDADGKLMDFMEAISWIDSRKG